ncbi:MAG TPA: hypothetical protein ACFYD3_04690 [Candidatus Hypogeohydataceae bacterium YC41]
MEKYKGIFGPVKDLRIAGMHRGIFLLISIFLVAGGGGILAGEEVKDYQTVLRQPIDSETKQFEDEKLRINFYPTHELISFTLQNKTKLPMKIIWDEIIFTNPEGETRWVINKQVHYKDRGKIIDPAHPHIAPTEVSSGQTYVDYIRPFPIGLEDELIYPFKDAKGSRFKLVMPLEIEGHVNAYTFAFEVIEASAPH